MYDIPWTTKTIFDVDPYKVRRTWRTYIGGYYKSPDTFIEEARRIGISRRIPAQQAKGMQFGDRVVALRWMGKDPRTKQGRVQAFAEFTVTQITLENSLGGEVGRQLADEGRARLVSGAGATIQRSCGSYTIAGSWGLAPDVTIAELIERAEAIAAERGEKVFVMLFGRLDRVYEPPVLLIPPPKFFRGFAYDPEADPHYVSEAQERGITLITGYAKG